MEDMRDDNASQERTGQVPTSAAGIAPTSPKETTSICSESAQDVNIGSDRVMSLAKDGEMLSEIRKPLQTISKGVEELATTIQDLLDFSDSDSNTSGYDSHSEGSRVFSWAKVESRARQRRRLRRQINDGPGSGPRMGAKDDTENDGEGSQPRRATIAEIRECNFEQFQSRASGDSHSLYCVDVLIAGDSLDKEINNFKVKVAKIKSGRIESWKPNQSSYREQGFDPEHKEEKWIRRIRINSRAVLEILRHLHPESKGFGRRTVVFHRPFQLLVSIQKEINEQWNKIQRLASDRSHDEMDPEDPDNLVGTDKSQDSDRAKLVKKFCENKDSLNELACYVAFMETRIMPESHRYRGLPSSLPKTIRHEDLWYLFKPGDLVYVAEDNSGGERVTPSEFSQRFIRVIQTRLTPRSPARAIGLRIGRSWSMLGHFIEHDGASYAPVPYFASPILPYTGEKKVTELHIYPVSYLKDDTILLQAQSDGTAYVSLIEQQFGFYSGWTQTVTPYGSQLTERTSGDRFAGPKHVESDVVVDFQETFKAIPHWKPGFYMGVAEDDNSDIDAVHCQNSDLPLLELDEAGRASQEHLDQILRTDPTEVAEAKAFMKQDMLGQFERHARKAPTGEFLALLPRRLFAYAVLERRFLPLDTRFVRSAYPSYQAFNNLEIDRHYKLLILALVKSHFDKFEAEKRNGVDSSTQDLICGKGKGVVILLHGVPGVGKTATAEAVALKMKRPLFPIKCRDLGNAIEALENSLIEIFRLAHHWGCILLLDEAEVFVTQRERRDLKGNALVSAFLRVLEYFNGIIFLTTNRPGAMDEAVKSRVHLSLYYDHLTEEQTVAIFKQQIQRLRDIERQRNSDPTEQIWVNHKEIIQFARDHFNQRDNSHGSGSNFGRWNGRQIRNAFLIASSLAHYDSEDDGSGEDQEELEESDRKRQKQLGRKEFELVAKTMLTYDQYRESVFSGKSDDHVAFERGERAMPPQPRPPTPDRMRNIVRSYN